MKCKDAPRAVRFEAEARNARGANALSRASFVQGFPLCDLLAGVGTGSGAVHGIDVNEHAALRLDGRPFQRRWRQP